MKPEPEYLEALRASGQDPERLFFRGRPDRWPRPRDPSSPFVPGAAPYSGPAMPGADPFAEWALPELERDAFAVLFRGGYLAAGDRVPWRGCRAAWLEALAVQEGDSAAEAARTILEAAELAALRDGEGAFAALAALSCVMALADAARIYSAAKRAGERGAAARKLDRKGRRPTVPRSLVAELRAEAAELRRQHPRKFGAKRSAAEEIARRCARSDDPERQSAAGLSVDRLARLLFPG